MLARVSTFAIDGIGAEHVYVETDLRTGLPTFTIVGLVDRAVQEARERVRAAIVNSGFEFPLQRIIVNLAPAHLRKTGPSFDLSMAICILVASGQLRSDFLDDWAVIGELSLSGEIAATKGTLAVAEGARRRGFSRLLVPRSRVREAALIDGLEVAGASDLREAAGIISGNLTPTPPPSEAAVPVEDENDLSDVRGQNSLIPALEVAAAGGHNIYLHGPPGTGKTMLARRLPTILPPMTDLEAIEVTRIHSVAGKHGTEGLVAARPFRSPHHTISSSGLVGGGVEPTPGEATLAHHGVLFLDELTEFRRSTLDVLRQPLEDGKVAIVRSQRLLEFPTRFMFVAAANPCPCGLTENRCRCSAADLQRYQRKMSGPLLDRIDIVLNVARPSLRDLRRQVAPTSKEICSRVTSARERQQKRFNGSEITCNARMGSRMESKYIKPTGAAKKLLHQLYENHDLSARGHSRILRVARTVADLGGRDSVDAEDVMLAASYRFELRPLTEAA
jgi:magnesium chelatase family protein